MLSKNIGNIAHNYANWVVARMRGPARDAPRWQSKMGKRDGGQAHPEMGLAGAHLSETEMNVVPL